MISENGPSSSALGFDDNQNTSSESNQAATSVGGGSSNSKPDGDCLFDPSLPKCVPDEVGNCPDGFGMNEDEQCFPLHDKCLEGYHSHEDYESGRCIPNAVPCDSGYIMNPEYPSCDSKDRVCQNHPDLGACKQDDDGGSINLAYKSGYNHGCSDAKIYDNTKRYINQQEKGPVFIQMNS